MDTNLSTSNLSTLLLKWFKKLVDFSIYQYIINLHQILN